MRGRDVILLGLGQMICWGAFYYLIGIFGGAIGEDLGWTQTTIYGGYTLALLVMAAASPLAGSLIEQKGGSAPMALGAVIGAAGCATLAASHSVFPYFAGWVLLGLAMRLTLYDAAFAALARIAGPRARKPMAQITLFGGLSSTIFWPFGGALLEAIGWRGALLVYAGVALLAVPCFMSLPQTTFSRPSAGVLQQTLVEDLPDRRPWLPLALFALTISMVHVLSSAMSAHMIGLFAGLGLASGTAVAAASLRGIGQFSARLADVLFGSRLDPRILLAGSVLSLTIAFGLGLTVAGDPLPAFIFAFLFGAGNGVATIAQGAVPLVILDPSTYGSTVGRLLVPAFLLAALAPLGFAAIVEALGGRAALGLGFGLCLVALMAATFLLILSNPKKELA